MLTSDKVKTFIDDLSLYKDKMNRLQYRMLEELERNYRNQKDSQNKYVEFVGLAVIQISLGKGQEASDFEIFKPYLEKVVQYIQEFIEYWGYKKDKYDTLLDKYEIGLTTEKLDKIFEELKIGIIEILNNIKRSKKK